MRRRLISFVISLGLLFPVGVDAASSRGLAPLGSKSATFQEQLEKGLQPGDLRNSPSSRAVVVMVQQQQLPLDLVRSTFDWVHDKRPYPYPYFERGLKKRAARLGITVR